MELWIYLSFFPGLGAVTILSSANSHKIRVFSRLHNQVWVTTALTEGDVPKALLLCASLRRVFTSRKVAVVVSPKLARPLREALNAGFDLVFFLDEDVNTSSLKVEDFAKLYAMVCLRSFAECVYLSPEMMALKNCDDIFEQPLISAGMIILPENSEDLPVFLFKAASDNFKALLTCLRSANRNGSGIGEQIKIWVKNQQNRKLTWVHKKYNVGLTPGEMLHGFADDLAIVNLSKKYPNNEPGMIEDFHGQFGVLGKLIAINWQEIYQKDVQPLLMEKTPSPLGVSPHLLPMSYGSGGDKEPIAIVGMSCRFPGSNNLEEFWELLFQGQEGICPPPPFRWRRDQCTRFLPESGQTNAGFLKVPVDEFDAKFFGISPKEVLCLDPQVRLLHELVWEGLEDACVNPHSLEGTSGAVFIGSWTNDYKDIVSHSGTDQFFRAYMGNSIGAAAARISHLLGLTGPSVATESGCSSAMVAVHLACRSLQLGETNMALACGVNLLLHPFDKDEMAMVISPDGRCKTFSDDANGFARAEGCAVLVLKRLSEAVKDGDRVWALIKGSGVTQEGISKSMGTPTVHCESLAMTKALKDAEVSPEQVSYVETHGTGTVVGDPMEVEAIAKAYHSERRAEPLIIGSVKTNVGHTESCSGITGIIKVALAMHHEVIPAHRNFVNLNPSINLDAVPAVIPLERQDWRRTPETPRLAGVSSFGITGTDAHAIIEEAPILTPAVLDMARVAFKERPWHILRLSAKTDDALQVLLEKYQEVLQQGGDSLGDVTFSANTGRANFPHRVVILGENKANMVACLQKRRYVQGTVSTEGDLEKICFLFTGQGSQYPGMARSLYETCAVFRVHFDHCEKILRELHNVRIKDALWPTAPGVIPNGADVNRTIYSQTSIFCVEYCLLKVWESWGVQPDGVLGHSLGEFCAAVAAGMMTLEEALMLVAERSRLIEALPGGSMLVVKASQPEVEKLLKIGDILVDYAAVNSPDQTVVAGDTEKVRQLLEVCREKGVKAVVLPATHAFHSRHMDPMLREYRKVAGKVKYSRSLKCQYISGVRGALLEEGNGEMGADYWIDHTREKVSFLEACTTLRQLGYQHFVEIGPQPVLAALVTLNNENAGVVCVPSLKKTEDPWQTMLTSAAQLYVRGHPLNWAGMDMFRRRQKVRLPSYPFQGKKFWPDLLSVGAAEAIHPLVGAPLRNASATRLYQSGVNLRGHEYLKDHCIGHHVIFPGAAYLEMCLVAGWATVGGSQGGMTEGGKGARSMKVENLNILAPLVLDAKTTQLQTVLEYHTTAPSSSDWNNLTVKIFHREEGDLGSGSWLLHATAVFSPLPSTEEQQTGFFDRRNFLDILAHQEGDEELISQIYDKLGALGLHFGPMFRSVKKCWGLKGEEGPGSILVKVAVPPGEEEGTKGQGPHNKYMVHPVVLDALLQAIMMLKLGKTLKKKLYVPIKIGKFVWLSGCSEAASKSEVYVQVFENDRSARGGNTDSCTAYLLDSRGTVLGIMSGVEFLDTTAQAVESVLKQQTSKMPDLWEQVWRWNRGPLQDPVDLPLLGACLPNGEGKMEEFHRKYNVCPDVHQTFLELSRLSYHYMLRVVYEFGWERPLQVGGVLSEQELFEQFKIGAGFRQQFHYFCCVFEQEGIFQRHGGDGEGRTWRVVRLPPTRAEIEAGLQSSLKSGSSQLVERFAPTLLIFEIGANLVEILTGKQSALNVLFPAEEKDTAALKQAPSAKEFYTDYVKLIKHREMTGEIWSQWLQEYQGRGGGEEKPVFRVLEVGAGTGGYTRSFLEAFEALGIEYEYTFTDISSAFFPAAEKKFEKYGKRMRYKRLNIEEDPLSQGFVPEYYDLISANDVLHATRNLKEAVAHVGVLLKEGGVFELFEAVINNRFVTFMFGLLEGFWRFEDFDVRKEHCIVSGETWRRILGESGLPVVGVYPCANDYCATIKSVKRAGYTGDGGRRIGGGAPKTWVVFHQDNCAISTYLVEKLTMLGATGRRVVKVERAVGVTETLGGEVGGTLKIRPHSELDFHQLFEKMGAEGTSIERILYCWSLDTTLTSQADILQPFFYLVKAVAAMKQGSPPRIAVLTRGAVPLEENDVSHFPASTILGFTRCLRNEMSELPCKCIEIGGDGDPTLEENWRMEQIFYELWNSDKDTQVAYQERSRYVPKFVPYKAPNTDLPLPPGTDRFQLRLPESRSISDLKFVPLENLTLGREEVEVQVKSSALNFKDVLNVLKPTEEFKDATAIGFDFAGVVQRVGDQVTQWQVGDSVFGVNVNGAALPSHIKLHQEDVLRVPEEMTLNEACTLPAVVSTSFHCLVDIAQVGPADTVLIHAASGGVGLSAIQICQSVGATIIATAGSRRKQNYLRSLGIQYVFHSRSTQYGAHILKVTEGRGVNVVLNSLTGEGFKEATLQACAQGCRFVEMSKLSIWTPAQVQELRPDVIYTVVDVSCMETPVWRRLLRKLMDLAEKKTITSLPYVRFNGVNIREALQYLQKAKHLGKVVCVLPEVKQQENGELFVDTPLFNNRSTYLITGGMGGIGVEVCKWMLQRGAKYILLAGRRPPRETVTRALTQMKGVVHCVTLDIGDYSQCRDLLHRKIGELGLPPLRGVMQAAGTLNDGLISSHTWDSLAVTFPSKIDGSWNLHELTKSLRMEHFVLFSSVAAMLGSPGQSNHSAGNYFEDTLAYYRHSLGLPATTINWGQWSEVGIATEIELPGLQPFSTLQGMATLEYALTSQRVQTSVLNVESLALMSKLLPQVATFIDERVWRSGVGKGVGGRPAGKWSSDSFWEQYDAWGSGSEKREFLQKRICEVLRDILKMDDADPVDDTSSFEDMGVDSLMFVEMKNELQALFGERVTVNASAVRECSTVGLLTNKLMSLIQGEGVDAVEEEGVSTREEVDRLIKEDCVLPDFIRPNESQTRVTVDRISSVLVTGATGTLGPYILQELSKRPQIKEILCLMRSSRKNPEERLKKILAGRELLDKVDLSKIRGVQGNVAQAKLGMSPGVWTELGDRVDAVFHCAASVQHIELYKKRKNPGEEEGSMRGVNVGGVKNILEFCCAGEKLKQVYCASSLVSVSTIDKETGLFSEEWPHPEDYNGITTVAYPVTKFVGDVLMREAVEERGVPGKVFRFPAVMGDSATGRFTLDQNHLMMRYLYILKTGTMPSNPLPMPLLPVDVCAQVSVDLFFQEHAPPDIYNVINRNPDLDQKFVQVAASLGYRVDLVEFSEFTQKLRESSTAEDPYALFKDFYRDDAQILAVYNTAPALRTWVLEGAQRDGFFKSRKVAALMPQFYEGEGYGCRPSMDFLYRDMLFAQSQGWLPQMQP